MVVVTSSVWVLPSRRLLVRANPNPRDQNMVLASHFANASDTTKPADPIRNLPAIFSNAGGVLQLSEREVICKEKDVAIILIIIIIIIRYDYQMRRLSYASGK